MSTQLINEGGDLLWDPKDFGDYSIERVRVVSNILKALLESTTLNMSATLSESALANVYSKEQVDNKFMSKEYAELYVNSEVRSVIDEFVASGKLPSYTDVKYLTEKLTSLYSNTLGIDLDGNDTKNDNLKSKVLSVESSLRSQEDILSKVVHIIYKNGSTSGGNVIGDLDKIEDPINNTSLVDAINYLYSLIPTDYVRKSVVGDIESLEGEIQGKNIVSSLNLILKKVNELSTKVLDIESRISDLEKNTSS